jgi:hypothetical protein
MTLIEKSEAASPKAVDAAFAIQNPIVGSGTRTGPSRRSALVMLLIGLLVCPAMPIRAMGAPIRDDVIRAL